MKPKVFTKKRSLTPNLEQEKAMAPHSSTLAWKILWMEEPGRLQSMGSLRVGYDWVTSFSLFTFMHWRCKWQPTPVFLPGESQGQGSLVGCCLWRRTESNTTEVTSQQPRTEIPRRAESLEISQSQKEKYCIPPPVWGIWNSQILSDKRKTTGNMGWGWGRVARVQPQWIQGNLEGR